MSLIQIQHLSFRYESSYDMIFEDMSLSFDTSFKCALIGRNARGKTTLLQLMMGKYEYNGQILMNEQCVYFPYEVADKTLWTIDVCQHIDPALAQWQLEKELNSLDVSSDVLYRSFDTLSQGEQTKVLLAVLFLKKHTYLLIDEPTNHLDQQARLCVAQYLKKQRGFLLVSHDRMFIDSCCDHIIAINPQTIDIVNGNFTSWYTNKEYQDENEKQMNQKLRKDIKQLEKSKRQKAEWSQRVEKSKIGAYDKGHVGHMAAKMMKRSKVIEQHQNQAIAQKQKLLKNIEEYEDLKMFPLEYHQKTLLSFLHGSLRYGEKILFHDFSLTISKHDRVLLKGSNGCGKSSVIAYILDKQITYTGEYYCGSQLQISYVPQDCSALVGFIDDLIESYDVDATRVKTILRKLGFSRIHLEKRLENLSEGQKKKVMLAISLASEAHLYIWDEPLNYIDIFSRMQIEKVLLEYQPTLLFVEHDVCFQEKIATKVIDFHELV